MARPLLVSDAPVAAGVVSEAVRVGAQHAGGVRRTADHVTQWQAPQHHRLEGVLRRTVADEAEGRGEGDGRRLEVQQAKAARAASQP